MERGLYTVGQHFSAFRSGKLGRRVRLSLNGKKMLLYTHGVKCVIKWSAENLVNSMEEWIEARLKAKGRMPFLSFPFFLFEQFPANPYIH